MKLLIDFFPILLFFAVYKWQDIYWATGAIIVATIVQISIVWLKDKKVEPMHLITLVLVVGLGGLTLAFQDERFIKVKPTIVNWLFAIGFLGSQFIGKANFIERLMGKNVSLPAAIWVRLNVAWVLFFTALGALNLYVAHNYDTDTWVNFKLFGMLGLTIAFVVAQSLFLARHMQEHEEIE